MIHARERLQTHFCRSSPIETAEIRRRPTRRKLYRRSWRPGRVGLECISLGHTQDQHLRRYTLQTGQHRKFIGPRNRARATYHHQRVHVPKRHPRLAFQPKRQEKRNAGERGR